MCSRPLGYVRYAESRDDSMIDPIYLLLLGLALGICFVHIMDWITDPYA
jgi:hypothetical protein